MASTLVTTFANTVTQDLKNAIRNAGSGPGGTPQVDARTFAGMMADTPQMVVGTVTIDTNGAANGVEVDLPFNPRYIELCNEGGGTAVSFRKFRTANMLGATNGKKAFKNAQNGDLTLADNSISFTRVAGTAFTYGGFSIISNEATDTHVWHFMAIG